ncbi:MAG: GNAT family N-acetyltransferase [Burkholderiales bacterium]|nr:GNAT family N-acetyltransferase [Burkholderiales bacterium]
MDGAFGPVSTTAVTPDRPAAAADLAFMDVALALADEAGAAGEVPIGAVVVVAGEVVGRGMNRVIRDGDTTAHAEIVALREAFQRINNYRVPGATVYSTVEPCAMCAGALLHARVSRVVWGAADPKFGAAGSIVNLFAEPKLNHHARSVEGGVAGEAAAARLKRFFAARRHAGQTPQAPPTNGSPTFRVKTATWPDDHATLKAIRFEVFVDEQGVPAELEVDSNDPLSIHAIAWINGEAAACGRLLPDGHVGRMAVLQRWRGKGAGAAVLRHLIERARQRGDREVVLSAQTHAIGFYEKFGFIAEGEIYPDCDIPHREMRKPLD